MQTLWRLTKETATGRNRDARIQESALVGRSNAYDHRPCGRRHSDVWI
jgi:hypothetical protein